MTDTTTDYTGPLIRAQPAKGEVRPIDGRAFWPRTTSDDEASRKAFWSLNEALAWLCTGDLAMVSGVEDCENFWSTEGDPSSGSCAAWSYIDSDAMHFQPPHMKREGAIFEAAEELRAACENGEVEVSGLNYVTGSRELVQSWHFNDAKLGPGNRGQLSVPDEPLHQRIIFENLLFRSAEVSVLRGDGKSSRPNKRPPSPKKLAEWAMQAAAADMSIGQVEHEIKVVWGDGRYRPSVEAARQAVRDARAALDKNLRGPGRPSKERKY